MFLKKFFLRRRHDKEFAREIDHYIEVETADNLDRGMNADEARAAAIRKFGNQVRYREEAWDMNTLQFADTAWRDTVHGLRQLKRSPGFAVTAVLSLAVGIGANTTIFQLLDTIALRSLPVADPAGLAQVKVEGGHRGLGASSGDYQATYPLWEQVRQNQQAFSGVFAWGVNFWDLGQPGQDRRVRGLYATGGMFATLGVRPYRGRLFDDTDDRKGCPADAGVLSYALWQSEFGGRGDAIGAKLTINGAPLRIVGVTPPGFFGMETGRGFDVAVPNCVRAQWGRILEQKHVWTLNVTGRLKSGWSIPRAAEYLKTASPAWFAGARPDHFDTVALRQWDAFRFIAEPGGAGVSELKTGYRQPLLLLQGIALLVLLLACANLANLLLARAAGREREVAVRLAIGASRGRIAAQFLTESLLLAAMGGVLALAVAQGLSRALVRFLSTKDATVVLDLSPDFRVCAFVALVALGACILFGLAPAFRSSRANLFTAMKSGARGSTAARGEFRLQRAIIAAQVAFSLMLVSGAYLFVRSFQNVIGVDAGFTRDGLVFNFINFGALKPSRDAVRPMQRDMLEKIRAIPGIESAGTSTHIPLSGSNWSLAVRTAEGQTPSPQFTWVSPGYLKTMRIPLKAGRDIVESDTAASTSVVLVNPAFIKRVFHGADPIGQTVHSLAEPGYPDTVYTVVGVVGDTRYSDIHKEAPPIAYAPEAQNPQWGPGMAVVIRSSVSPAQSMADVRSVVRKNWPAARLEQVELQAMLQEHLLSERLLAWVSGFFALLALALATLGLYGVISHITAKRHAEIGIRIALGATRGGIVGLFARQVTITLMAGLALGAVGSFALMRAARALLFSIQPGDPWAVAFPAAVLSILALAAASLPAFRAAGQSPAQSLRAE